MHARTEDALPHCQATEAAEATEAAKAAKAVKVTTTEPAVAWQGTQAIAAPLVGDAIFVPNDTISVQKRTNAMWAAIRGAHRISKKNKQGTKGNTSGLFHQRSYAKVAAAPA